MSATAPKTRTPAVFPPFAETQPTSSLAVALAAFQAQAPTFKKSKTARVQTRTGGEYTYKYADLGDILPVVGPLLASHGLSWSSKPGRDERGELVLHFTLRHVSGEIDEGEMPLGVERNCKPQELGSALTYMRRYALTAQLNIATDEDDDGGLASEPGDIQPPANNGPGPQPTAAPPKQPERPANAKQKGMLNALAAERGLSAGDFANMVLAAAGDPPRAWRTEEHADQTLKRLIDRLPANLVTAVKTAIVEGTSR